MDNSKILEIGRKVIKDEREVLEKLEKNLQDNFILATKLISELKGRLIVTGIGKSEHIGKKMAATFASIGIPSFFIHSTEAVHGDLGMLKPEDMVLAISNSGEIQEVINLLPILKRRGIRVMALTGKDNSTLGKK
jgi:arabinose-5-phosphate isomerase